MKIQKKSIAAVVLLVFVFVVVGVRHINRIRGFSDLIPFSAESILRCEISTEATDAMENTTIDLSAEQLSDILNCLELGKYKYAGKSSSMQNCYARIFLWTSNTDHTEIMLSETNLLMNSYNGKNCPVYEIVESGDAIAKYITAYLKSDD